MCGSESQAGAGRHQGIDLEEIIATVHTRRAPMQVASPRAGSFYLRRRIGTKPWRWLHRWPLASDSAADPRLYPVAVRMTPATEHASLRA